MEKTSVDDLEPDTNPGSDQDARRVAEALGTEDVGINYYELDPGQDFSSGIHTHMDQEEIFYVIEGTATFETPDGSVEVGADEAIRFAPGDYQRGKNESDGEVRALGLGAPKGSSDIRIPQTCQACGESDSMQFIPAEDGMSLQCPECGETFDLPG